MAYPTDVSVPLLKDIKSQAPQAQCVMRPTAVSTNLIINRDAPPFDNPDIRARPGPDAGPQGVHRRC